MPVRVDAPFAMAKVDSLESFTIRISHAALCRDLGGSVREHLHAECRAVVDVDEYFAHGIPATASQREMTSSTVRSLVSFHLLPISPVLTRW